MLASVKALLYLGAILLVGSGAFLHFVYPKPLAKGNLLVGTILGAFILLLASDLDIVLTTRNALGSVDKEFLLDYLSFTNHGNSILLRVQLIILVVGIVVLASQSANIFWRSFTAIIYLPASLALLATFSWNSHAAAVGGNMPIIADLIHFGAAAFWGGPLFYFAFLPIWKDKTPDLIRAAKNLSYLGLTSVVALFITGIYSSALHIYNIEALISSSYGQILIVKLLLVFTIVTIAGINRLYLLPKLNNRDNTAKLGKFVKIETLILLGVLIATGILTISPLPHG